MRPTALAVLAVLAGLTTARPAAAVPLPFDELTVSEALGDGAAWDVSFGGDGTATLALDPSLRPRVATLSGELTEAERSELEARAASLEALPAPAAGEQAPGGVRGQRSLRSLGTLRQPSPGSASHFYGLGGSAGHVAFSLREGGTTHGTLTSEESLDRASLGETLSGMGAGFALPGLDVGEGARREHLKAILALARRIRARLLARLDAAAPGDARSFERLRLTTHVGEPDEARIVVDRSGDVRVTGLDGAVRTTRLDPDRLAKLEALFEAARVTEAPVALDGTDALAPAPLHRSAFEASFPYAGGTATKSFYGGGEPLESARGLDALAAALAPLVDEAKGPRTGVSQALGAIAGDR